MKYNKYLNYLIIISALLYLLFVSWYKWGNLIVDTFTDPWIAYKLTQGNVLYRDIHYVCGILPPYFISSFFKIFGVNLNCLISIGILITVTSTIFTYRISRLFLSRSFSTLATLNFLFVFAFGCYCYNGIFNFILPYNFASIFFTAFILSSLYFFIKFIQKDSYKYLALWCISIYLTFLSRVVASIPIWAAFTFIYLIYAINKRKLINILYAFIPIVLTIFTYYLFLYLNNAFSGFKESIIDTLSFKGRSQWELNISGFNNIPVNLLTVVKSFIFQLIAIFILYLWGIVLSHDVKGIKLQILHILKIISAVLVSIIITSYLLYFMNYFNQYRLMPLLLLSAIFICCYRILFNFKTHIRKYLSILTLFSISFILILRIILNVSPNSYGFYLFYLLPPGLICYYVFFIKIYPSLFKGFSNKILKYYLISLFIFFSMLIFPFAKKSFLFYKNKNLTVHTSRGTICSFNDSLTKRFWDTVSYIMKNTPSNSTVVVFPEGIGINYFSNRNNPLKYYNFAPTQTIKIGENNIINQLAIHKVDYIIITSRTTSDQGYPFFGFHYGQKIYSWILDNYKLIKLFGPYPFTSNEYGIAIYNKK